MQNLLETLLTNPTLINPESSPYIREWDGAVCFLIIEDSLFLINRKETMPTHKGQIAFIGGHRSPSDSDPISNALREFEEETGISHSVLQVLKIIEPLRAINKLIVPIVCLCNLSKDEFLKRVKSNGEWDEGILYPIGEFLDLNRWSHALVVNAASSYKVNFFRLDRSVVLSTDLKSSLDYSLWGASAKMILKFIEF